jgi:hypothetical protein
VLRNNTFIPIVLDLIVSGVYRIYIVSIECIRLVEEVITVTIVAFPRRVSRIQALGHDLIRGCAGRVIKAVTTRDVSKPIRVA